MNKVLVILGPTATGKTDLALSLAKKFSGELISCDSRQVYQGLDIGTGKLPRKEVKVKKGEGFWEMDGVKVWMLDVVDPKQQYTVYDYIKQASLIVEDILKRGRLPIVVGGTGLYLKGILEGISNLAVPVDRKLRGELEKLSLEELQNKLKPLSPIKWKNLNKSDRHNKRRLIRAIELAMTNPYRTTSKKLKVKNQNYDTLKIGLTAPQQVLNQKIDSRLISRIDQGLIEEGEDLLKKGLSFKRMKELGLEYGILADLLSGKINKKEFIEILKIKIHQYAKRQLVWFKKEKDVLWFDITSPNFAAEVEKTAEKWYYLGND